MLPLLWIAALLAQNPAPPAAASVFRSGTDVVRLDIRVTDEAGQPIVDLRPEELRIVDEGRPRPVLLFERVEQPTGDLGEAAARAVRSAISTNDGAPTGHLFVLVFDQSHIAAGNEQRARRAAEQFLRTYVRRGDRVAVYALPGPGPQIGFTADVARASASLVQVRGGLERTGMGALGSMRVDEAYEITRGNQEVLTRVVAGLSSAANFTDMVGMVVQRQAGGDPTIFTRLVQEDARTIVARADAESRQFLQRFADLVRQLGDVEGRKVVVLFSEGFFADNVSRELEQVAAAAARAYGAVYAIDLNQREIDPRQVSGGGGEQFGEIHARIGPLATLAAETDGELLHHANSWMSRALARAADQSAAYYLVGFAPSEAALRDRAGYHRVKVQVTRPGAHVNARTGYSLAPPVPPGRRDAIDRALRSPFPQHGIRIEYTTYQIRGREPGRESIVLALEAALPVGHANANAGADVVFVVRSAADGRTIASGTDLIPLPRTADRGSTTGTGRYRVRFEVPPGDYLMRAVVREPGGLVGSADRRLAVRRLDAPFLTAGDLVLSSRGVGLPVRAAAYNAEMLTGSLVVYGRTASQLEHVSVTLELVPAGSAEAVTSIRADLPPVEEDANGPRREARVALPLEGIGAGHYIARAVVRDGAEQVAELLRDVEILDGAPPDLDDRP